MKRINLYIDKQILYFFAGLVCILSSCIDDTFIELEHEQGVTFYFEMPEETVVETRSEGTANEILINNLYVLAFDKTSKILKEVFSFTSTDVTAVPGITNLKKVNIIVSTTSDYKLVALANLNNLTELSTIRGSFNSYISNKTEEDIAKLLLVTNTSLVSSKWILTASKPSPVWGELTEYGTPTSTNTFKMLRMLAKIKVTNNDTSNFTISNGSDAIQYYNYNRMSYVIPEHYDADEDKVTATTTYDNTDTMDKQTGLSISYTATEASSDHIYVFEAAKMGDFPPKTGEKTWHSDSDYKKWLENPCLIIRGKYGTDTQDTYYRLDFVDGTTGEWLDVLRNHSYNFVINGAFAPGYATAAEALTFAPRNMDVTLYPSSDSSLSNIDMQGPYFLSASHKVIRLRAGNTAPITIKTNYNLGKNNSAYKWTVEFYSDAECAVKYANYKAAGLLSISGYHSYTTTRDLALGDPPPPPGSERYIKFIKGPLSVVVKVVVEEGYEAPKPYVGAFWRANQTAERLIRMPMPAGNWDWEATVIDGENWIWMDTEMTKDPKVTWDATTQGGINEILTAEQLETPDKRHNVTLATNGRYRVSGSIISTASGNERCIYFRIGLKDPLPGYDPNTKNGKKIKPRYGVVLLTYRNIDFGDTYQKRIWIRQGEAPDFLYEDGDNELSRPNAVRFSAFNLGLPDNKSYAAAGGAVKIDARGGKEVLYPTQAGAHFTWASDDYPRYAYNPSRAAAATPWDKEVWGNSTSYYWDAYKAANETCPAGYRRPTSGSTAYTDLESSLTDYGNSSGFAPFKDSEVRQSLFRDNDAALGGNALPHSDFGYYADGFFDRRALEDSHSYKYNQNNENWDPYVSPQAVVSSGDSKNIAYNGRVIYNEKTNASLFFPACGIRDLTADNRTASNRLSEAGGLSSYFSASSFYYADYYGEHLYNGIALKVGAAIAQMAHEDRFDATPIRCVKINNDLNNESETP